MAANLEGLSAKLSDFDSDRWLLNVENGVLNLRTGKLEAHDPARRTMKLAPVVFDPHAKAPAWEKFLDRIFAGDRSLVDYVQRAAGYSMTGDTGAQAFFILHGSGANGKTTFLEAVRFVLGDYSARLDTEAILATKKTGGATSDLARLHKIRFVCSSEIGDGRRANEALIKDMTGGAAISARFLYKEPFEFKPVLKLWIDTNARPTIGDESEGFWRRVRLIPFEVQIPEDERDPDLPKKLEAEASGILSWILEGCLRWQKKGRLVAPKEVTQATNTYRSDMDSVAQWLEECCERDATAETQVAVAYRSYREWAQSTGLFPFSLRRFSESIVSRGFAKSKASSGAMRFECLRLELPASGTDPWDEPPKASREPGEDDDDPTPLFPMRPADEPRPNSPEDLGVHKTKEDEGGTCAECGSTELHTLPMNGVRLCRVHWYAKAGAKPPEFSR